MLALFSRFGYNGINIHTYIHYSVHETREGENELGDVSIY